MGLRGPKKLDATRVDFLLLNDLRDYCYAVMRREGLKSEAAAINWILRAHQRAAMVSDKARR